MPISLKRNSTLRHYKSHDQLTGSIEIAKAVSNRWRFLKSQPFSLGISSSRYEFQYSVFCLNLHDIWRNALLLERALADLAGLDFLWNIHVDFYDSFIHRIFCSSVSFLPWFCLCFGWLVSRNIVKVLAFSAIHCSVDLTCDDKWRFDQNREINQTQVRFQISPMNNVVW